MSVTWKLNGTDVSSLGYGQLKLLLQNQLADELTFDDPAAEFDDTPAFAIDAAIALTRTEGVTTVTWFRGHMRGTPRTARPNDSKIGYRALGPWQWLERTPYLQTIKVPTTPSSASSGTTNALSGRVILGQSSAGAVLTIGAFLNEVFDAAIAAAAIVVGSTVFARDDFSATISQPMPWDQVRDLSCAEAVSRILQLIPDAVLSVDYAPTTPKFYLKRTAALTGLTLNLTPPNDSSDFGSAVRGPLEIRERPELLKKAVVIIYLSTNRANESQWLTEAVDFYPALVGGVAPVTLDANGYLTAITDPANTLVRTVELAGVEESITTLQQPVNVDAIPSALVFSGAVTSGGDFTTLSDWWKKHAPELLKANVTIKAFLDGTRTQTDGTAITSGRNNELVKGAITDWMENEQGIGTQSQVVQVGIDYEISDPADSAKKERIVKQLHANIIATNAATRTYSVLESSSYTPPEAQPSGLAQAIYEAISTLQRSGQWLLTEQECTVPQPVGRVLTIAPNAVTGGADMAAPIQRSELDLDRGESRLFFGSPGHLGLDDLVEIYRVNRVRQTVTSYSTRTSGQMGSTARRQSLTIHHPKTTVAAGERTNPRHYTHSVSVAGVVPTSTEVATALAAAFTGTDHPVAGDVVNLTVSCVNKLAYVLTLSAQTTDGLKVVSFTVSSVTYYGFMVQRGLY